MSLFSRIFRFFSLFSGKNEWTNEHDISGMENNFSIMMMMESMDNLVTSKRNGENILIIENSISNGKQVWNSVTRIAATKPDRTGAPVPSIYIRLKVKNYINGEEKKHFSHCFQKKRKNSIPSLIYTIDHLSSVAKKKKKSI